MLPTGDSYKDRPADPAVVQEVVPHDGPTKESLKMQVMLLSNQIKTDKSFGYWIRNRC